MVLKKICFEVEDEGVLLIVICEILLFKEMCDFNIVCLFNIVYVDGYKFYFVFEFFDFDLKKYMELLFISDGGKGKVLFEGISVEFYCLGLGDLIIKKFMS